MSKIVTVNFAPEGYFEYVDVRIARYLGLNDYERWPTFDEIIEVGQRLADRIITLRRRVQADWKRLHDMSFDVERITGISNLEIWDQDFKRLREAAYKKVRAAKRLRLAVIPDIPRENYTVDPFVGWACLVEVDQTGDAEVDRLAEKYMYDIIWKRGYLKEYPGSD